MFNILCIEGRCALGEAVAVPGGIHSLRLRASTATCASRVPVVPESELEQTGACGSRASGTVVGTGFPSGAWHHNQMSLPEQAPRAALQAEWVSARVRKRTFRSD